MVNYDLIEKIKDTNEDFKFRLLRKTFKKARNYYPFWFLVNIALSGKIDNCLKDATFCAAVYIGLSLTLDSLANKIVGDIDKEKAIRDLKLLSRLLSCINVNTSFELLQESKEYEKKHTVKLSENKVPYILQEKYIMVPTYNDSDIKDVSVLQQHVIGTNKYALSIGSPTKVYKLAFANH